MTPESPWYPARPHAAPAQPTEHPWPAPWAPHPGPDAGRIPTGGPAPWHQFPAGAGPIGRRGPRWRRTLLVGTAVLAVVVSVAIALLSGSSAGPVAARGAAQAYVEAQIDEDWEAEWDMLCALPQLSWQSPQEFAQERVALFADFELFYGDTRPAFGEARYIDEASAYLVDVGVTAHDGENHFEVIVAEERGTLCIGGLR